MDFNPTQEPCKTSHGYPHSSNSMETDRVSNNMDTVPTTDNSWSARVDAHDLPTQMGNLHISDYNSRPIQFHPQPIAEFLGLTTLECHMRPGDFAVIAVDNKYVAGVLDTLFFKIELTENWHLDVLHGLQKLNVKDIYCCDYYWNLKRAAGDSMNVYMDAPERHIQRYPCNVCCSKFCAVQLAYLGWKRVAKRRPCNLEH